MFLCRIPVAFGVGNDKETRFIVSNMPWDYLYQFAGCDLLVATKANEQYKFSPLQYSIRQEPINNWAEAINASSDYEYATGNRGVCHSYLIIRYWENSDND